MLEEEEEEEELDDSFVILPLVLFLSRSIELNNSDPNHHHHHNNNVFIVVHIFVLLKNHLPPIPIVFNFALIRFHALLNRSLFRLNALYVGGGGDGADLRVWCTIVCVLKLGELGFLMCLCVVL